MNLSVSPGKPLRVGVCAAMDVHHRVSVYFKYHNHSAILTSTINYFHKLNVNFYMQASTKEFKTRRVLIKVHTFAKAQKCITYILKIDFESILAAKCQEMPYLTIFWNGKWSWIRIETPTLGSIISPRM